jgi:hypothetical protein
MPQWWNWYTRQIQNLMASALWVQVPLAVPSLGTTLKALWWTWRISNPAQPNPEHDFKLLNMGVWWNWYTRMS